MNTEKSRVLCMKMKRILLMLVGALMVTFHSIAREFAYTYEGNTLIYTVQDDSNKIVSLERGCVPPDTSGDIKIPSEVSDGTDSYSVKIIGYWAFSSQQITSVYIPASITDIVMYPFTMCEELKEIVVEKDNPNYSSSDGVLFDKEMAVLIEYPRGKSGGYEIPASVNSIYRGAFCYCNRLSSIVIPESVTLIDYSAFCACESLTSISLPQSLKKIGDQAFSSCYGLTSIYIPESVSKIGGWPFSYCRNLEQIEVAESNKKYCSIEGVLFDKNVSLLIQYPGGKRETHYAVPESVIEIGDGSFNGCSFLISLYIPSKITKIHSGFYYCESFNEITVADDNQFYSSINGVLFDKEGKVLILYPMGRNGSYDIPQKVIEIGEFAFCLCKFSSIIIPESVIKIGWEAFSGNANLESIVIPGSVQEMGDCVFWNCPKLNRIYYNAKEPKEFLLEPFNSFEATLYVPEEAIEMCRQIEPWKNFKTIKAFDFAGVKEATWSSDNELPCEVYTLEGVRVGDSTSQLAPGVYIIHQGKSVRTIMVK